MKYNFDCTACGKCCTGAIPLTWKDAQTHSSRFPLCFLWTPVEKGARDFSHGQKIGVTMSLGKKQVAVIISPYAYIPSHISCPELTDDNKCAIHEIKPLRCQAMPFYPYKEERFQGEELKGKNEWECDFTDKAPVVFENSKIVDRKSFDAEFDEILNQVPHIKKYSEYMAKYYPQLNAALTESVHTRTNVITSLSTFLTAIRYPEAKQMAMNQIPVLEKFMAMTKDFPELEVYFNNYKSWHKEMTVLATRKPTPERSASNLESNL